MSVLCVVNKVLVIKRWHTHRMNGFMAGGCTKCHSCGQDNMYIHWCGVDYTHPTYCEGWCGYVYCQNPSRKCAEIIAKARFWRKNRPIRHLFKKFIKTWKRQQTLKKILKIDLPDRIIDEIILRIVNAPNLF